MQEIKKLLKQAIKNLYNLDFDPEITPSPENIAADYSSNAPLKLAKTLHQPPMQIAEELKAEFDSYIRDNEGKLYAEPHDDESRQRDESSCKISLSAPGFLNFILSEDYLQSKISLLNTDFDRLISSNTLKGQTVICEFSDPNPFKVLHVGHLYTSIVGDSIARLFEYAGARVIRANFGGDVGLHVAKTMYILKQKDPKTLTIEDIAKCYIEGTAAYEEDEAARSEITRLNKTIYQINSENLHDSTLAELYWQGRELSYAYFNDFYHSIGVKFDKYYPESSVAHLGLTKVRAELEKGVYELSNGAVIFNGEKYGLHTRVFINQEGVPTYEAKDVGLIFQKNEDYHFDKSVVITGSEQLEYMKVVLKSVEQYAPELVAKTTHLTHGMVRLQGNVKMSSRKGNFLKAVDVLDMVKTELKSAYASSDDKVALAATKYAFLKYKMGGDIIFDPEASVKMTGNSGPYLLYSAVRAKKILEKSLSGVQTPVQGEPQNATTQELIGSPRGDGRNQLEPNIDVCSPCEHSLMKKLLEYKTELASATTEMAPHKIANYLYELAQTFSRFYENCPVVGDENASKRLKIVGVYLKTMTHGLNILGIEIPEEM